MEVQLRCGELTIDIVVTQVSVTDVLEPPDSLQY
jgi:hypothetical protein